LSKWKLSILSTLIKLTECPFISDVLNHELLIYTEEMQKNSKQPHKHTIKDALDKSIIKNPWHGYWLGTMHKWFVSLGAKPEHFRIRQHVHDELSHYASDTWDLEYKFPIGWKELAGVANRGDFDLQQHMKHSKSDMNVFDEETKMKVVPHVVCEPSQGVERTFLVFLFDAYEFDKKRENVVLHLHPLLAPVKVAVFPLINKEQLQTQAKELVKEIGKEFTCTYDQSGTVGRRYSRNDEQGTPFCITVDFEGLEDGTVTIRDRDSTLQARIPIEGIRDTVRMLMEGSSIETVGKIIKPKEES
jgi:glycyl-tRNA synthetase